MASRKRIVVPPFAHEPPPPAPAPPPPPPTIAGDGHDCETFSQTYPLTGGTRPVFTTLAKWRGCDVYVSATPTAGSVFVTVRVFAVVGNVRALISTGRFVGRPRAPAFVSAQVPKWVAAARGGAVRFDVTVEVRFSGFAPPKPTESFSVAVIASNDLVSPPPSIGAVSGMVAGPNPDLLVIGDDKYSDVELIDLWGYQTDPAAGVPTWAMLFDLPLGSPNPVFGDLPDLVWPVCLGTVGSGFSFMGIRYRQQEQSPLVIALSTTGDFLTPVPVPAPSPGPMLFAKLR